jgi:hypothetical protein
MLCIFFNFHLSPGASRQRDPRSRGRLAPVAPCALAVHPAAPPRVPDPRLRRYFALQRRRAALARGPDAAFHRPPWNIR